MGIIRAGYTAETAERILGGPGAVYSDYDLPAERPLGATRGGNSFNPGIEWRDIEIDIPYSNVRGLRKLQSVQPVLTVNLLEMGIENWKAAVPGLTEVAGTSKWATVLADDLGDGDGIATVFVAAQDAIDKDSARVFLDDGTSTTETEDFTVHNVGDAGHSGGPATAEFEFGTAPASGTSIIAQYRYDTGNATDHTILRMDDLADSDYLANVAVIADVAGRTNPAVFLLENVLGSTGSEVSLQSNDEGVLTIEFSGFFKPQDMEDYIKGLKTLADIVPWEVHWPNS